MYWGRTPVRRWPRVSVVAFPFTRGAPPGFKNSDTPGMPRISGRPSISGTAEGKDVPRASAVDAKFCAPEIGTAIRPHATPVDYEGRDRGYACKTGLSLSSFRSHLEPRGFKNIPIHPEGVVQILSSAPQKLLQFGSHCRDHLCQGLGGSRTFRQATLGDTRSTPAAPPDGCDQVTCPDPSFHQVLGHDRN